MSKLRLRISISLDGYVAGPRQSVKDPLGVGGERLHEWAFAVATFRKAHGMEGGDTGPSDQIAAVAQRLGVSPDQAASVLAQVLPGVVDAVTPDGKVPSQEELEKRIGP